LYHVTSSPQETKNFLLPPFEPRRGIHAYPPDEVRKLLRKDQ
jgi:hypothetical protein